MPAQLPIIIFADQRPITLVPTVEFVDGSGEHLAAPMIGSQYPGFLRRLS